MRETKTELTTSSTECAGLIHPLYKATLFITIVCWVQSGLS